MSAPDKLTHDWSDWVMLCSVRVSQLHYDPKTEFKNAHENENFAIKLIKIIEFE